ncbi:hypothetical protein NL676_005606 [Syzygium grande]|nr:hypothetical protein NL676_005606 [Syzygium grande]
MDRSPLLSIRTETCGTYETPSPPSPDPNETNQIVPANNSMPSNEQQNWKYPSIYKVPAHITILRPEAYQPQLPMLVLYHLVAVEKNKEPNECINEINKLILSFYSLDKCIMEMGRCLHVMDVFRKGLLMEPQQGDDNLKCCSLDMCIKGISRCLLHIMDVFKKCLRMEIKKVQPEETEKIIRSANELNKTGIQFKKSPTQSLKDISFAGGVLKLPVIMVDGTTESKFLNLMTFERLHIGTGNEITSYTTFMDNIINNEQDVALLHAQGIIQNAIGSDKAVAELFNSLCTEVTVESNSRIDAVQVNISKFYDDPSNSWWANFRHTYFRNPWTVFSFIAAILLFALTIIQTAYTMLSYY